MALLQWTDELQVDISRFDEQHKRLIALVNEVHDAMLTGKGRAVVGDVLDELIEYTEKHFTIEEDTLTKHEFPECVAHRAEHQKLLATARELQEKHKAGSLAVTVEVLEFLKQWVTEHIKKCDKKYSAYLRERGES